MPPTTVRTPPSLEDFTPLEVFQSQTPESFTGGKPVLHFHLPSARASIPASQAGTLAIFPSDATAQAPSEANGNTEDLIEREVDVFVNSDNFLIFSKEAEAGITIPYPSISIHALKHLGAEQNRKAAIWMQLEFADGGSNDDDYSTVELTIIPPSLPSPLSSDNTAKQMYEAMAACSDLHPDPNEEDDDDDVENHDRIIFEGSAEHEALEGFSGVMRGQDDGGLPPPLPGSGGWITAENMHEYFDEEGNWIGEGADGEQEQEPGELGEGAGTRRVREDGEGGANGDGPDEAKRARVD